MSMFYFQIFHLIKCAITANLETPSYPMIVVKLETEKVKVCQLCPTLCDPIDYTVHGIQQIAFDFKTTSPFDAL